MSDDTLPELIDVVEESKGKNVSTDSPQASTAAKEDEFKLIVSKRKRKESKMDQDLANKSTMEDDEELYDTDEEEMIIKQSVDCGEKVANIAGEMPIKKLSFPPIKAEKLIDGKFEMRKVHIPPNRLNPLKESWMKIYSPVVEFLKLQIRFNLKSRNVELRVTRLFFFNLIRQRLKKTWVTFFYSVKAKLICKSY
jgi:hypothetical protein